MTEIDNLRVIARFIFKKEFLALSMSKTQKDDVCRLVKRVGEFQFGITQKIRMN
jgi:hypothetical protein